MSGRRPTGRIASTDMTKANSGGDAVRRVLVMRRLAKRCADAKFYGDLSAYYGQLAQEAAKLSNDAGAGARDLGVVLGYDERGEQVSAELSDETSDLRKMRDAEIEKLREQQAAQTSAPLPEDEKIDDPAPESSNRKKIRKVT